MATKKKKAVTEAAGAPEEDVDGRWRRMMESGTTEAEYQEPVVPVGDTVEEYLRSTYPRLDETQNIPKLLYAILREIVTWRLK